MTSEDPQTHLSLDSLGPDLLRDSEIQLNLRQTIIIVTEDKALLCLKEYESRVARDKEWVAPASGLAAIVLAIVSASFRDVGGVSAETWEAIFWIAALLTAGWLLYSLIRRRKHVSPEDVVQQLMAVGQIEREIAPSTTANRDSLAGRWSGTYIIEGETYPCSLEIVQDDESGVIGELEVTRRPGDVVRQRVTGTKETDQIHLSGELLEAAANYNPDDFQLEILNQGTRLIGQVDDGKQQGPAEFRRSQA